METPQHRLDSRADRRNRLLRLVDEYEQREEALLSRCWQLEQEVRRLQRLLEAANLSGAAAVVPSSSSGGLGSAVEAPVAAASSILSPQVKLNGGLAIGSNTGGSGSGAGNGQGHGGAGGAPAAPLVVAPEQLHSPHQLRVLHSAEYLEQEYVSLWNKIVELDRRPGFGRFLRLKKPRAVGEVVFTEQPALNALDTGFLCDFCSLVHGSGARPCAKFRTLMAPVAAAILEVDRLARSLDLQPSRLRVALHWAALRIANPQDSVPLIPLGMHRATEGQQQSLRPKYLQAAEELHRRLDAATDARRLVDPEDLAHIMAVIDTNAVRVVYPLADGSTAPGTCLLPMVGLCQHSCVPNCALVALKDRCQFQLRVCSSGPPAPDGSEPPAGAAGGLPAGQRLTIAYVRLPYVPTYRRRRELFKRYGFWCWCSLCRAPDRSRAFLVKGDCPEACVVCPRIVADPAGGPHESEVWMCEQCGWKLQSRVTKETLLSAESELHDERQRLPSRDSEGLLARMVSSLASQFDLSQAEEDPAGAGQMSYIPGHPAIHERHHHMYSLCASAAPLLFRKARDCMVEYEALATGKQRRQEKPKVKPVVWNALVTVAYLCRCLDQVHAESQFQQRASLWLQLGECYGMLNRLGVTTPISLSDVEAKCQAHAAELQKLSPFALA